MPTSALPTTPGFNLVAVIGAALFVWYGYQVFYASSGRFGSNSEG